ncbi:MAG: uracil phosphoribosyltransferase [Tissierellia bacterium]|nr:uracil phosphoribosyltransferase [Tissierellia bacterium]
MSKVTVLDHPLIKHKVSILRDVNTGTNEFRKIVSEISQLMCYEVTRDLQLEEYEVETPLEKTVGYKLSGKKLGLVPILRAGLGMVDGMLSILPSAKVGHIGLYRDPETLKPVEYYVKLPTDVSERDILVLDPMLATGGSAIDAINSLKQRGCKKIRLINIIGAPEGLKAVQDIHPDVDIYIASLDRELNDHAYILPGLGDAGDRLFGTK